MSLRCRHAFEYASVHANGDVVCSIIDGRGDFVIGNVYQESLGDIFHGKRAQELRRLMLSHEDAYCPAVGKRCPLKTTAMTPQDVPEARMRFLAIEPTTACDLRCLACPVRDFHGDTTWRDAYRDGGWSFLVWDGVRRAKQHAADHLKSLLPMLDTPTSECSPAAASLLRGRVSPSRNGTLPIEVLKRVVSEAGPDIERVDLFNFGEPFLYKHLVDALRHVRSVMPRATVHISTDGMQVREAVERALVDERLVDWLIFSVDGTDEESYQRYRIGGQFEVAFSNMLRFHQRAKGTGVRVVWQYVVFRWNDTDEHFQRALSMANEHGIDVCFDFAYSYGRSRRTPKELQHIVPHLKPLTSLPGEPRPAAC